MNKGVIFPFALCLLFILSAGCDKGQQGGEAKKPEQKPSESINPVFALAKDNVFLIGASDVGYLGTAFLVNFKEKRYAVTNFHVIERSRDFFLENESRIAFKDVTVVAADRKNDVAVLKVNGLLDSMKGLNYSTEYLTSQKIYISGYPDTKSKENHINFGSGVISDANYVAKNYIGKGDGKSLQFTIEINPGSSGSPVMNEKGDVLGVVAWYRPDVKGGNYAVPFNYVLDLLVEIENTKQNFSEIYPEGKLCQSDEDCSGILFCIEGKCQKPKDLNHSCIGKKDCYRPYNCYNNICAIMSIKGLACVEDSLCKPDYVCIMGTCQELGDDGAKCKFDQDCKNPLMCIAQECSKEQSNIGGKCSVDNDCLKPLYCINRFCQKEAGRKNKNFGEECSSDTECKSYNYCILNKCGPIGKKGDNCQFDLDCVEPLKCKVYGTYGLCLEKDKK